MGTIALPLPNKAAKTKEKHTKASETIIRITSTIFIHFFRVLLFTSNKINEAQKIKVRIIKPKYDVRKANMVPAEVLRT
jgi:hypothetical protein